MLPLAFQHNQFLQLAPAMISLVCHASDPESSVLAHYPQTHLVARQAGQQRVQLQQRQAGRVRGGAPVEARVARGGQQRVGHVRRGHVAAAYGVRKSGQAVIAISCTCRHQM